MKKALSIIFFTSLLLSCSHQITSTTGYIRPPKNYKFSYSKNVTKLINSDIIDTTAIYYLHNSNFYKNSTEYKHSDAIIRFYSDGRFKTLGIKDKVSLEDINNNENGIVGYYTLEGRKIKLQMFTDHSLGFNKLEFGFFNDKNDLVIVNKNPRKSLCMGFSLEKMKKMAEESKISPKIFKKSKVNGMKYTQPNW